MQKSYTPALIVDEGAVPLPENFQWGKDYVALRMWKELRDDGEFFFAACLRKYGPNDFGNKSEDNIYIGREIEWIGERITDTNKNSKTFGQRINQKTETVTERIYDEEENEWKEIKIPINATKTYNYLHRCDNKEYVKQYKTLVDATPRSGKTELTFIWNHGTESVKIKKPDEFFDHTVQEMADWSEKKMQTDAFKTDKKPKE